MNAPFIVSIIMMITLAHDSAAQQPRTLRFTVEKRFGAVDGPGSFTSIAGVAVDREGRVYATDGMQKHVNVFDAYGKFVRTIGRSGRGPGDFTSPLRLGLIEDTLWVADRSGRVSYFNAATGRVIRIAEHRGMGFTTGVSGQDRIAHLSSFVGFNNPQSPLLFMLRINEMKRDTLLLVKRAHATLVIANDGHPVFSMTQPYSDDPIGDISSDGTRAVVVTTIQPANRKNTGSMLVQLYDLNSKPPRAIVKRQIRYPATKLTDAMVNEWVGKASAGDKGPYFPKDREAAFRKGLYRPEFVPPVASVKLMTDGTVWLARTGEGAKHWLVLNRDLSIRGNATFNDKTYPMNSTGEHVWLVEYDDLDIPTLVRARMR